MSSKFPKTFPFRRIRHHNDSTESRSRHGFRSHVSHQRFLRFPRLRSNRNCTGPSTAQMERYFADLRPRFLVGAACSLLFCTSRTLLTLTRYSGVRLGSCLRLVTESFSSPTVLLFGNSSTITTKLIFKIGFVCTGTPRYRFGQFDSEVLTSRILRIAVLTGRGR